MAPNVLHVSRDELLERRVEVLRRSGLPEAELRSRAETGSLTSDEWDLLTELRHIDFLLGE